MPMQKNRYPPDWEKIALRAKEAADWTCEHCGAKRGEQQENRRGELKSVVITVAHLDRYDTADPKARLAVLCAACHLKYDAQDNAIRRSKNRRRRYRQALIAQGQLSFEEMKEVK